MGIFSRNRKIRATADAEAMRDVFDEDYALYLKMEKSDELKRYRELSEYVSSEAFKNKRKQVEQLRYKGSEFYLREREYKKHLKNEKLRDYYLIKESQELRGYLKIKETEEYARYAKLHGVVTAPGFDRKLRPDEYVAYRQIINVPRIKALILFEKNRKFRHYMEIRNTNLPAEFEQLTEYIKSDEFRKNREYLLNKRRYETTEDFKLLCEFEALGHRPDMMRFFTLQKDEHFKRMCRWVPVFEDRFKEGDLDKRRWITRYYAGERFLKDTYGVGKDVQLFMPDNVMLTGKSVMLNFKKEQIIGKYWDTRFGIREKTYGYTSGAMSTACGFRQQYGRIEAKVRVAHSSVQQCFGLRGDTEMPHVDIMKAGARGLQMGEIYRTQTGVVNSVTTIKDVRLNNDFYIFTLEWTRDKMVWMINDVVVKEMRDHVPDIPMYVFFRLGSNRVPGVWGGSAHMEIAWVRVYKLKDDLVAERQPGKRKAAVKK